MSDSALLHDPVSGATRRVTVTWDPGFHGILRIEDSAGTVRDVPAADLSLTQGGWRGDGINFAWQQEGQTWAVTLDNPQVVANLAKVLPANMSSQIAFWQKQSKRSRRWSTTALGLGALVTLLPLLLLLALFMMRDR